MGTVGDTLQVQLVELAEHQRLLAEVLQKLTYEPDELADAFNWIVTRAQDAVGADGARLILADAGGPALVASGPLAAAMGAVDEVALAAARRDVGSVLLFVEAGLPDGIAEVAAAPLLAGDDVLGVLWLGFAAPVDVDEGQRVLLLILAGQASMLAAHLRAVRAAGEEREWMAAILGSAVDPAIVVGSALDVRLLNAAAAEALGVNARDVMGARLDEVAPLAPLAEYMREEAPQANLRGMEFVGANGRTYAPSVAQVQGSGEAAPGRVLWLRDITHFKRVNANLSDFLSTVSHDMRTPLTFMKGYCDMMGLVGPMNERQATFVEKIGQGIVQMSDMVEKILDAGRLDPETGSYELMCEPTDLAEVAHKVVAGLSAAAEKKQLRLTSAIAREVPLLNVDRAMVSSAFTNLVENAIKYTPEGGRVTVELRIEGNAVIFRVTDNGLGISPEDQAKLFQRSGRVRRKEFKRIKGTGLGLFIVKNVAQRHGGDAWVESVEGKGSTFTWMIPCNGRIVDDGERSV